MKLHVPISQEIRLLVVLRYTFEGWKYAWHYSDLKVKLKSPPQFNMVDGYSKYFHMRRKYNLLKYYEFMFPCIQRWILMTVWVLPIFILKLLFKMALAPPRTINGANFNDMFTLRGWNNYKGRLFRIWSLWEAEGRRFFVAEGFSYGIWMLFFWK